MKLFTLHTFRGHALFSSAGTMFANFGIILANSMKYLFRGNLNHSPVKITNQP